MEGSRRVPTAIELSDEQTLFRANAVVALREVGSLSLTATEQLVTSCVDGFRPLARIRIKTGLSREQFRHTLRALVRKRALVLVALIEANTSELTTLRDEVRESGEGEPASGHTMPRATGDLIPAHVMDEIEAMLKEEERRSNADDFDDDTDVGVTTQTRRDDP